jgi:hypothetical protein
MVLRGRPSSTTPVDTVRRLTELAHVDVPGDAETRENRLAGLGALAGMATGAGIGALLGVARAAGWRPGHVGGVVAASGVALVGANGPMTLLKVTDPRSWSRADWLADLAPHLAYGVVTAAVLNGLDDGR